MSSATQHIRQAAAHEDAAGRHSNKFEEQMKAAGAEMYAAFVLALKGAEEYRGRKLDDKAILRIYQSTKPRPWWDKELVQGKLRPTLGESAARKAATYLIQWHVDPEGARARRAHGQLQQAAAQKKLRNQRTAAARSMTSRSKSGPSDLDAAIVTRAATNTAHVGRELPPPMGQGPSASVNDLLGETQRIQSAARKVPEVNRDEALSILRAAARDIERYVP
jgi:hypothetical protein